MSMSDRKIDSGTSRLRGNRGPLGYGLLSVFMLLLALTGAAWAGQPSEKYPPTIVFMTDFGVVDDSVAICRGVMYSVMPEVRIVDLTHQVTPFSIMDGARYLSGAAPYYPEGTVFVVVIDPGVGSTRKAIVAVARRLLAVLYAMLRSGQAYCYAPKERSRTAKATRSDAV